MASGTDTSTAATVLRAKPDLRNELAQGELFNKLASGLRTVTIEDEVLYVAEGDTLLDEDQLLIYASQRQAIDLARLSSRAASEAGLGRFNLLGTADIGEDMVASGGEVSNAALLGIVEGTRLVRWAPDVVLTYCVLKNTFIGGVQDYETVRDNMLKATAAWEETCGVKFQYLPDLDDEETTRPDGVIFPVRYLDANGAFIAAAFFPNDPINRRRVVIDPSYFKPNLGFDPVGVLRHELGHVLGFRHEHIRSGAPPACPDEPLFGTAPLTEYDPQSVMHYFCGDVGSPQLAISKADRVGAQKVYGPPLSSFLFIS